MISFDEEPRMQNTIMWGHWVAECMRNNYKNERTKKLAFYPERQNARKETEFNHFLTQKLGMNLDRD